LLCDGRQVSQALINVLKNAAEAVMGREGAKAALPPGWIGVTIREESAGEAQRLVFVDIEDNGRGLPQENRDRLTEPYVTTRAKGTGLGLAIVKKIMEDHNGDLLLEDRDGGGARVSLVFKEIRTVAVASENGAAVTDVAREPSYAVKLHANG
jgi:two-component system nitrogen regulation sensor histidine kinase NtrY